VLFRSPIFLLVVLYGIYSFTFSLSKTPVDWFKAFFGWLGGTVEGLMPEGPLRSLLASGIIDGVGGVLGFVPLIALMFLAIALLEDSGYMARIAFIMDRVLRTFGLHGSSVLSLIVGGGVAGGCAVPAVMAARTLRDRKERLATILVTPMMNCGAKLPVYAVLIGAFFSAHEAGMFFLLTLLSWSLALAAAWLLRHTVLRGQGTPFVMELPPYRFPTFHGLLIHTWERTWSYLKKAGTIILAISILMWTFMTFPGLPEDKAAEFEARRAGQTDKARLAQVEAAEAEARLANSLAGRLGRLMTHLTAPLGFDWRTNVALVGGFAAKEVVLSTLATAYSLGQSREARESLSKKLASEPGWTPLEALTLIIFVMIYSPCLATVAIIRKEAGWAWALFSMAYTTAFAYLLALGLSQAGRALGLG
jgi:ferrous iron transport protein B